MSSLIEMGLIAALVLGVGFACYRIGRWKERALHAEEEIADAEEIAAIRATPPLNQDNRMRAARDRLERRGVPF